VRRLHLVAGIAALFIFLATGIYMRTHHPLVEENRLLFRSRHIYILSAALANLLLGAYVRPAIRWMQWIGSVLLLLSPLLLVTAFIIEPVSGQPPGVFSRLGLYVLLAGTLLHTLATVSAPAA